ncbi:MAG: hypothetical protein EAX81_08525 [Candidatus Thorarchaeota archaeon]|nr:hypothetical protein [Candidatus Thorarchaeota archaeon]
MFFSLDLRLFKEYSCNDLSEVACHIEGNIQCGGEYLANDSAIQFIVTNTPNNHSLLLMDLR